MTSVALSALPANDPLLEVHVRCGCGRRSTNVRIFLSAARKISGMELFDEGYKVGTWWCWRCKSVGILSARALHFAGFIHSL